MPHIRGAFPKTGMRPTHTHTHVFRKLDILNFFYDVIYEVEFAQKITHGETQSLPNFCIRALDFHKIKIRHALVKYHADI